MSPSVPDHQEVVGAIRQVESGIANGQVVIEGNGAFWRYNLVCAVCERLGDVSCVMISRVYGVLRMLEQGNGQPE